ncbi:Innexin inx1 [Periplaneta americana]|uniref:Innexin n=1 Tax=Periplaneta americana TaxID=6978 RepID=A0ABQ8S1F7_PERAM|nr:Innexin inx1 [Periplaneta americana]
MSGLYEGGNEPSGSLKAILTNHNTCSEDLTGSRQIHVAAELLHLFRIPRIPSISFRGSPGLWQLCNVGTRGQDGVFRGVCVGSHKSRHNMYAIRYYFCEALCLVNIIAQLYFMDSFFDGEFISYGLRVMTFSEQAQEDRVDPMVFVFPRVTKCTFHKYGPSGSIQKHDSLCILPLNIVNEKTYIFLWFWFMILATMLGLLLLYRLAIILFPSLRPHLLHARNRMVPREVAAAISRKTDIGDWWILYMLGRNMDPIIYREVMAELAKKIETAASNSP